jgi:K+-sensing histidine kinase KdpD
MTDSIVDMPTAPGAAAPPIGLDDGARMPVAARYALALLFVALATVLAFVVENLIAAPNLSLIYVLPVVIAATAFGWGPSLAATAASVLAFDFFFTEPKYTFVIASPADIWAAGLLLVVAAIVSTLAAETRRRAMEARRSAEQARALQGLAHAVIEERAPREIIDAAAAALNAIFQAPAVVFMDRDGALRPVGSAGRAKLTKAEDEAAQGALATRLPARAGIYPYAESEFDFWPVGATSGGGVVLGVNFAASGRDRPKAPEQFVDVVGAYLAAALGSKGSGRVRRA